MDSALDTIATATTRPAGELPAPMAWSRADLPDDAGVLTLHAAALDEVLAVADMLRANPLPTLALTAADFELSHCRTLMTEARRLLDAGPGFVILDRLPLDRLDREQAIAVYWLLAGMIARPVAQKWDGCMIYDVTDKGRPPGNGVRPDVTNVGQNFHTDNSYNHCPPRYVALFCLKTAMQGGVSSVVSFHAAHNEMRRRHPELLDRLYRPFVFDRQREHAPGDVMTLRHPMFAWRDGSLIARLSLRQVVNGYAMIDEELDAEGKAAIEAFETVMNDAALRRDFHFEPGQIQFVNNLAVGHRRTGFTDWPEPERKRHLVRLWLRDEGRPFYNG